jgi:hypothetical protein
MIGAIFYVGQRRLTITGSFEGHDRSESPGYEYRFDDETKTHWITASGMAVRFTKEPT